MSKECNIKKHPAMTVAYFRSLFLSPSIFNVFPLYLTSIYPCCQCLQRDLNGRHDSEWVIVGMRGLDRIGNSDFSGLLIWYQINKTLTKMYWHSKEFSIIVYCGLPN